LRLRLGELRDSVGLRDVGCRRDARISDASVSIGKGRTHSFEAEYIVERRGCQTATRSCIDEAQTINDVSELILELYGWGWASRPPR
jgi:hypothetical protein